MDNRQQNTRTRSRNNSFSQGTRNNRELRSARVSGERDYSQQPYSRAGHQPSQRGYSTYSLGTPSSTIDRKKVFIGLGALAAVIAASALEFLISNAGKVEVVSAQPYSATAQQPYQDCQQVQTTRYARNHKNGTEGAVIGGVGGAAVGGLITHSWVGAGVGTAVGAVGGDLIQRSHQPDYVAHHGSANECQIAYRQIMVPVGYQVGYLQDDRVIQIVTQHQPLVGSKIKLQELEADQVTPIQQQQLIQQAVSGNSTTSVNQGTPVTDTSNQVN